MVHPVRNGGRFFLLSQVSDRPLAQNYRIHAVQGFRVQTLETSLQENVKAIDDALSRFST